MIVLRSTTIDLEQLFTNSEQDLAVAIAKHWRKDGLRPTLYSKTYNGKFDFLNDLVYNKQIAA